MFIEEVEPRKSSYGQSKHLNALDGFCRFDQAISLVFMLDSDIWVSSHGSFFW